MKHLVPALALILVGSAAATAADINFGETRTRYQIQNELTARERLRPWDVDCGTPMSGSTAEPSGQNLPRPAAPSGAS